MNRLGILVITLVIALLLLSSTIFTVDQRNYAVVLGFSKIRRIVDAPGLHFKLPFPFENVFNLDKRIMVTESLQPERLTTSEQKNLLTDIYLKWRIIDPRKYYSSVKGDQRSAADQLIQLIRPALNEAFAKHSFAEIISTQQDQVMKIVREKAAHQARQIGIDIIDVRLRRIDLAENSALLYRRMVAAQQQCANELRATSTAKAEKIRASANRQRAIILAEAYRKAQTIKGEGDAQAATIYNQAFSQDPQFARFYQSMKAYRVAFRDTNNIIVVDPNADFFRFMHNPNSAATPSASAHPN